MKKPPKARRTEQRILDHPRLSPLAKALGCRLIQFQSVETGCRNPSPATLAEGLNRSLRSIRRAMLELETEGFIARKKLRGGYIAYEIFHRDPEEVSA